MKPDSSPESRVLALDDGTTTYRAADWFTLAQLVAWDGGFDLAVIPHDVLSRLYCAGFWGMTALTLGAPGVVRLRELIATGEIPYVVFPFGVDTGLRVHGRVLVGVEWDSHWSIDMGALASFQENNADFKLRRLPARSLEHAMNQVVEQHGEFIEEHLSYSAYVFRVYSGTTLEAYLMPVDGDGSFCDHLRGLGYTVTAHCEYNDDTARVRRDRKFRPMWPALEWASRANDLLRDHGVAGLSVAAYLDGGRLEAYLMDHQHRAELKSSIFDYSKKNPRGLAAIVIPATWAAEWSPLFRAMLGAGR